MYIPKNSKYDKFSSSKYFKWNTSTQSYDPTSSVFLVGLRELTPVGSYKINKYGMTGRLDLASYEIYGTTKLWWVLMLFNNIDNFYNVTIDTTIYYPSMSSIENLIISIKDSEGMWI